MALFVGKLDPAIPAEEVKEMFKKHGQPTSPTSPSYLSPHETSHMRSLSLQLLLSRLCFCCVTGQAL